MNWAIEIKNLHYTYPNNKLPVLKNISLKIKEGEFVFITGKSGCGKSTLAKCLNGTLPHILGGEVNGEILVNQKNLKNHQVFDLAQDLGFIFQNPESQFFTMKVEDEVAFGPENCDLSSNEIEERVKWALDSVEMSSKRLENVFNLSEGQKQRVAVAANLSLLPHILVLDEPTSNLDPPNAQKLFKILKNLKDMGKTLILIDHRTHFAQELADRVIIMQNGEIVEDNSPEILNDKEKREYYGIRNPQIIDDGYWDDKAQYNDLVEKDNCSVNCGESNIGEPVLSVSNLSYRYDSGFEVENIDFKLKKGETLGIIGSNGSGKTTLAKLLVGLLKPQKGDIKFNCNEELQRKFHNITKKEIDGKNDKNHLKVGLIFQNPDHQLFMDSVFNELYFGWEEIIDSKEEVINKFDSVLKAMNLHHLKNRHPHSLSGGEKQRTIISAFMVREPDVLILDEPTTGMDYYHMKRLVMEINRLKKEGLGIILISHDLEFLQQTTDNILLFSNGKLIKKSSTPNILTSNNLKNCFEGYEPLISKNST